MARRRRRKPDYQRPIQLTLREAAAMHDAQGETALASIMREAADRVDTLEHINKSQAFWLEQYKSAYEYRRGDQ